MLCNNARCAEYIYSILVKAGARLRRTSNVGRGDMENCSKSLCRLG